MFSKDYGKTWSKPVLSPFYAHRPYLRKLKSGRLLMSYRNAWGTTGTCCTEFDALEKFGYQPNSMIWDESCCEIRNGAMEVRTKEGREHAVEFTLYPVEDDDSAVEFEAELRVESAAGNACNISAGAWIRFLPGRVELADRPQDGFNIDTSRWRRYRIVNAGQRLRIFVDGEQKLETSTDKVFTRHVRFGNRSGAREKSPRRRAGPGSPAGGRYEANEGVSFWRSMRVQVTNRRDHSIDWRWSPEGGYPDQFRRDRVIRLEKNGTSLWGTGGYSSWGSTAGWEPLWWATTRAETAGGSPGAASLPAEDLRRRARFMWTPIWR